MEQRSQINISFLSTSFPRFKGDFSGNFVYRYAQELSEQGVNIEVVAPDDPASLPLSEKFKVVRFPYFYPRSLQVLAYGSGIINRTTLLSWFQLPFLLINFFIAALKSTRKTQLVHAFWSASGLIALVISYFKPRPIVITLWGSDKLIAGIPILSSFIFGILKLADAIICEDNNIKSLLISRGFNKEKIYLINNGIDLALFQPQNHEDAKILLNINDKENIILSIGSLNKNKNHSLLIDAFAEIAASNESWYLFIIGEGEERLKLEKQIENSKILKQVKLLGTKDHSAISQWLNAADIFVQPSQHEGTPNALLEAMACGLPVVASKVGGIPELIQDNIDGLLFESNSKNELVKKLNELIQNKELKNNLGKAATKKIHSQFGSWKNQALKLLSIYKKLLS